MNNLLDKISVQDQLKIQRLSKKGFSFLTSLVRFLILISVGFVIIYPLFYMITNSLVSRDAYFNSTRIWIPTDFAIKHNYTLAMDCLSFGPGLLSTLTHEIVSALIQVCTCAIAAYGFARFEFKGKGILMGMLFMTILVPDMMVMLPRMVNYSHLDVFGILKLVEKITGATIRPNILNTVWSFWLPSLFGIGLRSGILIFIYIQFFKGLPRELEEAAWVDGAGPLRTFLAIAIPSSGVVILTVTVFSLIWHWNDTLLARLFLSDNHTLATNLDMYQDMLFARFGILPSDRDPEAAAYMMSACVLFVTPMLIFYMIVQRWFIESIDRVGITG